MDDNVEYRIDKMTGWLMVGVAGLFDLAQAAAKLFLLLGLTALGAIFGAWIGAKIGFGGVGAVVGGAIGTAATALGFASGIGILVGTMIGEAIGWFFMIIGYSTLGFWLATKGITPMSGHAIERKMFLTSVMFIIDMIPFINIVPGLTLWTIFMIRISREEDEERAKKGEAPRVRGRMRRRYLNSADTEQQYI